MRYKTEWAKYLDEGLADGEWHDGLDLVLKAEKLITPGVAERRTEADRARMSSKKHGEAQPRQVEMSTAARIRVGKRAIMRSLVAARVRDGQYETDPAPLPRGAWSTGGWKLRSLRAGRLTIAQLARTYKVAPETMMRIVTTQNLGESNGRHVLVPKASLTQLDELIAEHRRASRAQRIAAMHLASLARELRPPGRTSLSELAAGSQISQYSARDIAAANPDLPWIKEGRARYLPDEHLPLWKEAVAAWEAARHDRRRLGAAKSAATRKQRRDYP